MLFNKLTLKNFPEYRMFTLLISFIGLLTLIIIIFSHKNPFKLIIENHRTSKYNLKNQFLTGLQLNDHIKSILHPPSKHPYILHKPKNGYFPRGHSWKYIYNFTSSLFKDKKSGFFIEAGALDGEFLSNTLWLEKDNGWNGILVEPHPSSFNELLKKNRKCWKLQSCLSSKSYTEKSMFLTYKEASFSDTVDVNWYTRAQTRNVEKLIDEYGNADIDYTQALCLPLESILLALNVFKVDFFSLDVEGAELSILKTINFDKFNIRSLSIESNNKPEETIEFMVTKGYFHVGSSNAHDNFFIHKSEVELMQKKFNFLPPRSNI